MSLLVFLDLETGGTERKHPVTQIGAAVMQGGREIASFERYLKFDESKAEPKALEIQHYDPQTWLDRAVEEQQGWKDLCGFLRQHATVQKTARESGNLYKVARVAGHNLSEFDMPRIRERTKEFDLFLPVDLSVLDTLHMARWYALLRGEYPENFKLDTLVSWLALDIGDDALHGALADCRASALLARFIAQQFLRGVVNGRGTNNDGERANRPSGEGPGEPGGRPEEGGSTESAPAQPAT